MCFSCYMSTELTSELTITSRCPDRRTGSATARTGNGHGLSGTVWAITGTTGVVGVEDILARLPKLRKDARANVKSVLHELTADKNATIPQICTPAGWESAPAQAENAPAGGEVYQLGPLRVQLWL